MPRRAIWRQVEPFGAYDPLVAPGLKDSLKLYNFYYTQGRVALGTGKAAIVRGGVVTDIHARVLKRDGSAIAGLYATGNSTASVMGRAYPGGGSCVGPSFVWGFVAASHACTGAKVESAASLLAEAALSEAL